LSFVAAHFRPFLRVVQKLQLAMPTCSVTRTKQGVQNSPRSFKNPAAIRTTIDCTPKNRPQATAAGNTHTE
jgi:hypothetical protein